MHQSIFEILIIFFLCIFQSIFGIGLLLFGTPIFLIIGNDFFKTLNLLLPISIVISAMQIYRDKNNFQISFLKLFNFFTIPSLIFSLCVLIIFYKQLNILILVSFMIILFSSLNIYLNNKPISFFQNLVFKKFVFIFIGVIHGLTNLGGSLLSLTSININNSKNQIRFCIAYGYLLMSSIQIISINIFTNKNTDISKFYLLIIPFIVFTYSQTLYEKIKKEKFNFVLSFIALFFGLYLLVRELLF